MVNSRRKSRHDQGHEVLEAVVTVVILGTVFLVLFTHLLNSVR
jgi:uncharacterized membrane protein YadS